MRGRRGSDPRRAGLSVLELLVALALLALIAGGLAGGMGLGLRLFERARALEALAPELALRTQLRAWLAAALPPDRIEGMPTPFEGRPDGMGFHTARPTPFAPEAALLRVEVRVEDDALVLEAVALGADGGKVARYPGRLADGVDGMGFAYHEGPGGE